MSDSTALMQAILTDRISGEAEALLHLEAALALEVDPLDYAVHRFGLGSTDAMSRAAAWAGLAFADAVPALVQGSTQIRRLDALAGIRTLRARLYGREVVFAAPLFGQFITLRAHAMATDGFRRGFCVVPPAAIRSELARASQAQLLDEARQRLSHRWPSASGHLDLTKPRRWLFAALISVLVLAAGLSPYMLRPLLVPLVGVILIAPATLRLWAALSPVPPEPPPELLSNGALPVYSVLIPLRDEAHMVEQLVEAMRALDYPAEKLDIKFVVEARSLDTLDAVRRELADPRFELVVVPDASPTTKPKALNYALPLVRGEHVVIYDAEDIPDPGQLRLAASRFAEHTELDCLQAELVIDNAGENALTALFAGEYAGQFGLMLPLLARLRLPMPLGGTSNHFRVAALREVGGWDAFNVTEDADLGVRLSRLRYRTATIASRTREEAPVTLESWMLQRTRWVKGWMQTFIVHNRRPRQFLEDIGWRGFLAFQIYVGSLILSAPLHAVFMLALMVSIWLPPRGEGGGAWEIVGLLVVIIGYGGAGALVVAGLARMGRRDLLGWQLLLPFYWLLHSVAMVRALNELLTRPYFWAKTRHGQTRLNRAVTVAQAE